jgi:lipopolysaccharide heptosyltransferase II
MDRLVYLLYSAILAVFRILPATVCARIGQCIGVLAYVGLPKYRRIAARNLRIAFPDMPKTERRSLLRRHFLTLAENLAGSLKVATLPHEKLMACTTIEGMEHAQEQLAQGRGCIWVICHLGNWELLSQLWPPLFKTSQSTIYQRLSNPHIDAAVRESRARLGLTLFERKEGFQGAIQLLRQGGGVGVLVDQHAGDAGVWCPFFRRLASTTSLPAMMALRSGAALLPIGVFSNGPGKWRIVVRKAIVPESRDPAQLTAQINLNVQALIESQPADWFWVHNRWKTPRPKFLLSDYKRGVVSAPDLQPFPILIRSSNWLGDAVMSLPALQAVRRGRPDARISVLTPAKLADFWRTVPEVDQVIPIQGGLWSTVRSIRDQFEVALVFPNSFRTGLEVFLAGIPRRVGYPGHSRRALLNQVFEPKTKKAAAPRHQVHHYLALAEFVGADTKGALESIARERPAPTGSNRPPVLGLCPGAEYGPAKRWLPERYADVMHILHGKTGAQWKVFGVAKDLPIAEQILAIASTGTNLVGKTNLRELIVELQSCDVLLTNDTGTMHLAAALGVPLVAVFGSTEPALTGPLGTRHRIVRQHVDCSPCFLRECPIDFRCMTSVTIQEVVAAVESLLPGSTAGVEQNPAQTV